ncbi:MAG: LysE family translocator [Dechloromonas sp.]|uniref:LysE family translocator n=1 Tax=Candidatus Dechloromonas phosphorivorans TaxID=2899244 RepID=A0A9D7LNK9_9RHOO|nr:LysE family translocator [Candidatus Dechloromonas phosphorivorans]
MFDSTAVLSAAVVCLAGVMSPGPNFVAVSHRAVSSSRFEAVAMVFGIAMINSLWAAMALFGLSLLVVTLPWMFWSIKLLGAAYLVWFGVQLLMRSGQPLTARGNSGLESSVPSALRDGIATNLANPKSMAFYASVFSGAVPTDASIQTLLSMVVMVGVISTLWYGSVALAMSTDRMSALYRQSKAVVERTCGVFLILLGGRQGLL